MPTPPLQISQSIQGYKSKLYVSTTSAYGLVPFGELDDISVNIMRDMLAADSHDGQGAKIKKPGLYDWNATAKGLHLDADTTQQALFDALEGATPLYITIYPSGVGSGLQMWQGACYIKDVKYGSPTKELIKAEFALEGSGYFQRSTQS